MFEDIETNPPVVSSEHLRAIAKTIGVLGNYSTFDYDRMIVAFARVVLEDKSVQEAFVKANRHLFHIVKD